MENLLNQFLGLDPDQSTVVLFATILVACTAGAILVAVLRSLGKWGAVALFVATAVVAIAYRGV
jgi:hypothetical protein